MEEVVFRTLAERLDWIETDGKCLLAEKRDLRVFQHEGVAHVGSLHALRQDDGVLSILTYGQVSMVSIPIETITRIEVFRSRRHPPRPAEHRPEQLCIPTTWPVEDTCP